MYRVSVEFELCTFWFEYLEGGEGVFFSFVCLFVCWILD